MSLVNGLGLQEFNAYIDTRFQVEWGRYTEDVPKWSEKFLATQTSTMALMRYLIEMNNADVTYSANLSIPPEYVDSFVFEANTTIERWAPQGVVFHRNEIGDPIYKTIMDQKIAEIAKNARYAKHNRWIQMLINGAVAGDFDTYDGQPLFSSTHTFPNGQTFDNIDAVALTSANLTAACNRMLRAPIGPNGRVGTNLDEVAWTLVIPPELQETANLILTNTFLYAATFFSDNPFPYRNKVEIIVEPMLTDVNDWYVIMERLQSPVKPALHFKQTGVFDADRLLTPMPGNDTTTGTGKLPYSWVSFERIVPIRFEQFYKGTQ